MNKNEIAQKLHYAINNKNGSAKGKRTKDLKISLQRIQMLIAKPLTKAMCGLNKITKDDTILDKAETIVGLLNIEDGSLEKGVIQDIKFYISQLKSLQNGLSLEAIQKEIDSIDGKYELKCEISNGANFYSVVSNKIELEGIVLGRFRAGFLFIDGDIEFEAEALEPNPCRSSHSTTHPHVRSRCICMGDGYSPAVQAVREGRIEDAFDIILSVLNTYSEGDAYESLEDWDGNSCSRCGETYSEEDSFSCANCGDNICIDCSHYCESCDDCKCRGCLRDCNGCGDRYCCMESCEDCGYNFCSSCMEEEGVCSSCSRTCPLCESNCKASDFVDCESCAKECCIDCAPTCKTHNKPCCNKCIRECLECSDCLCEESISSLRFCETCQEEKETNETAKN